MKKAAKRILDALTVEEVDLILGELNALNDYYHFKNDKYINACPLCGIFLKLPVDSNAALLAMRHADPIFHAKCYVCPWMLLHGDTCAKKTAEDMRRMRHYKFDSIGCERIRRTSGFLSYRLSLLEQQIKAFLGLRNAKILNEAKEVGQ